VREMGRRERANLMVAHNVDFKFCSTLANKLRSLIDSFNLSIIRNIAIVQ
jgi:hypothetical protein